MMQNLKLDSIVLMMLVVPFIMGYRIGPGDTPYWLFGLIFLLLLSYILLDILSFKQKIYQVSKYIVLWGTIIVVLGSSFISAIIVRHQTAPIYMVHDIIVQQEAALRFLIDGKNPYAVDYFGTPLEQWNYSPTEKNPALYHFVMQPLYLLFSIPFYGFSNILFGYFDGRIPLFFLFFSLLVMAFYLVKDPEKRRLFTIFLAFNPSMLPYTLEGRSDIFMYAFFFASLYGLFLKKYLLSSIALGLAFAVKQSVWPFFPFYLAYIYFSTKSYKKTLVALLPFFVVFISIVGPFVVWDMKAYFESTVLYLSGNVAHSYPISGYGFGKVLQDVGTIHSENQYYPFHLWQVVIGVPVLVILLKFLKKNLSVKVIILTYGIFLFVYWYFSRYFNNSHVSFLSMVFLTAYFWPENDKNV